MTIGWLFCNYNIHNNPSKISHVQWLASQVPTCNRTGVTDDRKGVTCDTSSVTCVHLWHGSPNMWRFYTVIYWRGYFTVDSVLVWWWRPISCAPENLSRPSCGVCVVCSCCDGSASHWAVFNSLLLCVVAQCLTLCPIIGSLCTWKPVFNCISAGFHSSTQAASQWDVWGSCAPCSALVWWLAWWLAVHPSEMCLTLCTTQEQCWRPIRRRGVHMKTCPSCGVCSCCGGSASLWDVFNTLLLCVVAHKSSGWCPIRRRGCTWKPVPPAAQQDWEEKTLLSILLTIPF